nr:MAG TPA: hypothetical protein [Caudoviricetes sp.]
MTIGRAYFIIASHTEMGFVCRGELKCRKSILLF